MKKSNLEQFLEWFPNKERGQFLFETIEGERIDTLLDFWYPGLSDTLRKIKIQEYTKRPSLAKLDNPTEALLEALVQYSLTRQVKELPSSLKKKFESLQGFAGPVWSLDATPEDSARACVEIYLALDSLTPKKFAPSLPQGVDHRGELHPDEVQKTQQGLKKIAEEIKEKLSQQGVHVSTKEILKEIWDKETLSKKEVQEITQELAEKAGKCGGAKAFSSHTYQYPFVTDETGPGASPILVPLQEIDNLPGDKVFAQTLKTRTAGLVCSLQRSFEHLRPQALTKIRKQDHGEEIDLDTAVDNYLEWTLSGEYDDRIYTLQDRKRRDVFVGLVLDASGSTEGGVLLREQEAAIGLTQALEKIGDDYCLYAFGESHVYCIKRPNEVYSQNVLARVAGLRSYGGTPLGTVVRHVTQKIIKTQAATKLLMVLSDGIPGSIPDACDAFKQARRSSVHSYLLAVEGIPPKQAEQIAGKGNYLFFDSASKLAHGLPQLYKRLTL